MTNFKTSAPPAAPIPANDLAPVGPILRSPNDTAVLLGVSLRTLQRMVRRGEAPTPVRVSEGRIAFLAREVDAWIAALPRTRIAA